jgi:hypothetical protein
VRRIIGSPVASSYFVALYKGVLSIFNGQRTCPSLLKIRDNEKMGLPGFIPDS